MGDAPGLRTRGLQGKRMKVLFVMHHAGFVRNYEPALRMLVERGHQVHVAYEVARNKYGENVQIERLSAEYPAITHGPAPQREDTLWMALTTIVRTLADYLRYFDPRYGSAPKLRERAEKFLPATYVRFANRIGRIGRWGVTTAVAALKAIDKALPPSRAVLAFARAQQPDVVLVTPLVDFGSELVDYVKTARALGIPSALAVASWDNLTNKGGVKMPPDRVFVWNEAQRVEAVTLHGVVAESVVVTGAQIFDHWFDWKPSRSRDAFCRLVGLDPGRPFILFLGSSYFLAPDEADFVERWMVAIRESGDSLLAKAGILIRPHPNNSQQWIAADLAGVGNAAVWPPPLTDPFDPQFKSDYYDSLFYSGAVVGVNTSALIEAAIVGRVVCTLRVPEFEHSQDGTLHFQHLVNVDGGLLSVATDVSEHLEQLRTVLDRPDEMSGRSRRFVEAFVRPFGIDTPATPRLVEAIEQLAATSPEGRQLPAWSPILRAALYVPALVARAEWNRKGRPWWVLPVRPMVALTVRAVAPLFRMQLAVAGAYRRGVHNASRRRKRARRAIWSFWYEALQDAAKVRVSGLKRVRRGWKTGRRLGQRVARSAVRRVRTATHRARRARQRARKVLLKRLKAFAGRSRAAID